MAPECDINSIMKKYEKTGVLEHRNNYEGAYGDFSDGPQDYHESMNAVLVADEMFSSLPAKIRRRFHNDPGSFIEFATNPENQKEMIALGLSTARQEPIIEPLATPVAKTTPKASKAPSSSSTDDE